MKDFELAVNNICTIATKKLYFFFVAMHITTFTARAKYALLRRDVLPQDHRTEEFSILPVP